MNTQEVLQQSTPPPMVDNQYEAACASGTTLADEIEDAIKESRDGEFHTLMKAVLKLAPKFREHAESITTAERNYESAQQIAVEAGAALDKKWERFEEWFGKYGDKVVALRSHFPKPGSHKTISIEVVPGTLEDLTWGGFVEKYLGVSLSYLNRLIKATMPDDEVDEDSKKRSEAAAKANRTKKRNAQERQAGSDTATETVVDVATETRYDEKDGYWLFAQIKDEPATLANEIAGMLMEFGFDLQQISTVLDLAKKIAKQDLKK